MQTFPLSAMRLFSLASPEADVAVAGAKGAALSRLIRSGMPVPPGFIIPTSAYCGFTAAREISDELTEAILDAYHDLAESDGPVAVRSSATAEDLPSASFAGQMDTYLNVAGDAALLTAIRSCWASLWNDRATAYRAHHSIDPAQVSMAVIVQRMVPAEASGVLFTVNPVTGDHDEIVINATWGLGEALVGGRVEPDHIVVDRKSNAVATLTTGDKAVMTVPVRGGTIESAVDSARRTQPVLTSAQAAELARLGVAIEAHMGGAQDIEWALSNGRFAILQARPVTALRGSAVGVPGDDAWPTPDLDRVQPFDLWTQADMGERWPEPVTPLTWSMACMMTNPNTRHALRDVGAGERDDIAWARRFYGRVYMNEGAVAELLSLAGFPTSIVDSSLGTGVPSNLRRNAPLNPRRLVRGVPRILRTAMERKRNETAYTAFFVDVERWVATFMERELDSSTDAVLWHELQEVWWPRFSRGVDLHADATSQAMSMMAVLAGLLKRWDAAEDVHGVLVSGVSGLRSAEIAPVLWSMADLLRNAGLQHLVLDSEPSKALDALRRTPAAARALDILASCLQQHGHRASIEAELRYPRWSEAPEQVIAALAGYLGPVPVPDPRVAEAENGRRRDEVEHALDARLNPLQRWIVHALVRRTQSLVRLRDNGQHYLVKLLLPMRHMYAEFGARWFARGWLQQTDDVFFLDIREMKAIISAGGTVQSGLDIVPLVQRRRTAYEHWFTVSAPEVIGADGRPVVAETTLGTTEQRLVGIAGSGGRATGPVRIAHNPQEASHLQPGEILVARSTDPGWTPAFALASGLILEVGGQLSHGAIVAREYGLPAVLSVRDALSRLRTGQTVTVDGTLGAVYLEDELGTER